MGKWLGAAWILLAALLLAHRLGSAERMRVAQAEAYLALLRHIRGQIACYSRSFGEICRRMEPSMLAACGLGAPGDSLACMLREAELCLPPEAERVLRAFAAELGRSYKNEQLAICDSAMLELEAIVTAARQRLPQQLRLIRCACLCGALAVILLLI